MAPIATRVGCRRKAAQLRPFVYLNVAQGRCGSSVVPPKSPTRSHPTSLNPSIHRRMCVIGSLPTSNKVPFVIWDLDYLWIFSHCRETTYGIEDVKRRAAAQAPPR